PPRRAGLRDRSRQGRPPAARPDRAAESTRRDIMIDIHEQIGSVRRHLADRIVDGREARVLTIGRTYDTTVEDLWQACTDPERIRRWFFPVSGELQIGRASCRAGVGIAGVAVC